MPGATPARWRNAKEKCADEPRIPNLVRHIAYDARRTGASRNAVAPPLGRYARQ
jgi:hypothetical protein